ncbi:Leucine-rich repeat (LRR) protein [Bradyrhizobium sp. USDA 326]|uniref:Leucine rich repeat-containing protein n=1 Tax=Bradyrhizobium yuanmingense TaxID=108015 RepID=A0A1C3XGY4_9BRAD|nr:MULTISPECIES: hypothetical protein [Bradyrhizobium]TWI18518.1 hypothetical protein IQ15_07116 [Bradyrhizobium yuanmingense]SCB51425.1 hypothetical protein GA0061099_10188 [Bradyrhizobium yuanmingense]
MSTTISWQASPTPSKTVQELDARGNRLTHLPRLPAGLQRLNVEYNQLADLPEPLPAEFEWLSASHNRLTSLPEAVSHQLLWFGASNNLLTSVRETLLTHLGRESSVNLENNPLADWVQAGQATAMPDTMPALRFSSRSPLERWKFSRGRYKRSPRTGSRASPRQWPLGSTSPMRRGPRTMHRFLDGLRGTVN